MNTIPHDCPNCKCHLTPSFNVKEIGDVMCMNCGYTLSLKPTPPQWGYAGTELTPIPPDSDYALDGIANMEGEPEYDEPTLHFEDCTWNRRREPCDCWTYQG